MNMTVVPPIDVRLMNAATSLLMSGLVLLLLAAALWWLVRNPVFAIRQITVTGQLEHNTAASLRAAVAPRLSGNFFTMDLNATRAAFEAAPWVRTAIIRREFPDRLWVQLLEHEPVARWGADDSDLVDRDGAVFATGGSGADDSDLPLFVGGEGQSVQLLRMYQRLAPLAARINAHLVALELQPRGHWRLVLDGGALVELGPGTADILVRRWERFVATVPEVAARHERGVADIEGADLRYRSGYALKLRDVRTGAEE